MSGKCWYANKINIELQTLSNCIQSFVWHAWPFFFHRIFQINVRISIYEWLPDQNKCQCLKTAHMIASSLSSPPTELGVLLIDTFMRLSFQENFHDCFHKKMENWYWSINNFGLENYNFIIKTQSSVEIIDLPSKKKKKRSISK